MIGPNGDVVGWVDPSSRRPSLVSSTNGLIDPTYEPDFNHTHVHTYVSYPHLIFFFFFFLFFLLSKERISTIVPGGCQVQREEERGKKTEAKGMIESSVINLNMRKRKRKTRDETILSDGWINIHSWEQRRDRDSHRRVKNEVSI